MGPLQLDTDAAQRAARQLRDAGEAVGASTPLPTGCPAELVSYVTYLAHAERRLATATGTLLETLGLHAQQVVTTAAAADR